MVKNFVTDTNLKAYFPKLANYIWSTQADYSTQITEAFNLIMDDLRARGLEPRTMMVPLDLKRPADSTSDQDVILTSSTETETTTADHIDGIMGFNRFYVNVSAMTGASGYAIKLQGSNEQGINDATEPTNWTDIATISPTATGESSSVFQNEFKYYRYVNTVTAGTPSITYTAGLYETFIDRWLIYKTFEMVFRDFSKTPDDIWYDRMKQMSNLYDTALTGYKFAVDADDNNVVDGADVLTQSASVSFHR